VARANVPRVDGHPVVFERHAQAGELVVPVVADDGELIEVFVLPQHPDEQPLFALAVPVAYVYARVRVDGVGGVRELRLVVF